MVGLYALIALVVLVIAIVTIYYLADRAARPAKSAKHALDDPLRRELVAFARKVAYYNDTSPTWTVLVPDTLATEARELLDKEKKELRIRNE